tara:strand:+ start:3768 stop:4850 length:1083 start_codon:yes stop_codon:yes gene_type:complete
MAGFFDNEFLKSIIDYVLIIGLLIITGYYIYKTIMDGRDTKPSTSPPAFVDTPNAAQRAELTSVEDSLNGSSILNAGFDASNDNAIRHFCIKSSSNSAYTGKYMNLNMIKYLLSRGCRFLDFEVYIKNGIPIVAYSTNRQSLETFTSEAPAVSLAGVFSTIMSNAFTDTSPNPKDPLFVHLRIKTLDPNAYTKIAKLIRSGLGQKMHVDGQGNAVPLTLDTQLPTIQGKVVVMVDKHSSPGYQNYSTCSPDQTECYSLANQVNMVSNSQSIRTYYERELTFQPINPPDPSVYLFRIVFPDVGFFNNTKNSDSMYLTKNYGTQVVAQAFYIKDSNLRGYEDIFKTNRSAFVRLETAIRQYE